MSFLAPRPNLPQSTTASQANQIPSFQGAVPMTLAYGRIPFQGARWLCDAYNRHTQKAGTGKPDWQYADIAASFGCGTARFLGKVRMNGQVLAAINHTRTTEDYIDYTFNPSLASGEAWWMRFYFGTETQTADASLVAGTGQSHPPYRGQPYAVFHNIDLGGGQTSIPSFEIEVGFETPAIDTFAAGLSHPYGVNPIAAIYGLLTTNYGGLGLDSSLVDPVHWGAQAQALEDTGIARRTGDLTHMHAVLSSFKDIASAASEWLTYFDGYLYASGGKLCIGWMPHAAVDPTSVPQITEADLTAAPGGGGFPDANAALSDAIVTYLDYEREYTQQGATYRAPANRKTQLASSPAQVDRPGCHAADQASYMAAETSATGPQQEPTTQLTVLRSRVVHTGGAPLLPGDVFNFDYNPEALDLVCRVTERIETDPAGPVQLTVIRERGSWPTPHVPPVDDRVLPTEDAPGVATSGNVRLWFLPSGFGVTRQVAALINRPTRSDVGAYIHLSTAGTAPWSVILDQRYFAALCAISTSNINNSVGTVRVATTSLDFARMAAQDAVAQADDTLCLLIGDELMSVGTISVVSAGVYDLSLLRGRQGSAAAAHVIGDSAWLFLRAELTPATHNEFYNVQSGGTYNSTTATKYFKTQLFTVDAVGLAKPDDPGISIVLPDLADSTLVDGYTILLGSEAHTVACDASGTVNSGQLGSGGTARTVVTVVRGGVALAAVSSGPNLSQFSISLGSHTAATATKESNDTVRADTLTADTGLVAIVVDVAGLFNVTKYFTLTKAKAGTAGTNGNFVESRYKRAATIPSTPTGDTPSGWPTTPPAADGNPLWLSTATKTAAGVLVGAWSTPVQIEGPGGATGPGLVYVGAYNGSNIYYKTAERIDVVLYSGNYYPAANAAKNGLSTWGAPGGADWGSAFTNFKAVATDLLLTVDATILKTLVMGDGATANAGIIRSYGASAFGTGAGYWLNPRNGSNLPEFRIGDPAGSRLSYDGAVLKAVFGTGNNSVVAGETYFLFGNPDQAHDMLLVQLLGSGVTTAQLRRAAGGEFSFGTSSDGGWFAVKDASDASVCYWDSSARRLKLTGCAIKMQKAGTWVPTTAGGSAEETFDLDISGYGFTAKASAVVLGCSSHVDFKARYDWDDAGNSSTVAKIKISCFSGANTDAGAKRFSFVAFE